MLLVYISGQGMVFRSSRYYESGTCLAIGMYLRKIRVDLGICEHGCVLNGDQFLNLRGAVADCEMEVTDDDTITFQVTLMFDSLGEGDLRLLESVEQERRRGSRHFAREKVVMGLN